MPDSNVERQMERARAARAMLVDAVAPPASAAEQERRDRGELEAFMAIFHPGHEVPDADE